MNFECPHCNQRLSSEEYLDNQEINCPSCEKAFVPVSNEPPVINDEFHVPQSFSHERLRDRKEQTAFYFLVFFSVIIWLGLAAVLVASMGSAIIYVGIILLIRYYIGLLFIANLKANALQVSSKQFPEIYDIAKDFARSLNKPVPVIYIIQHNVWNAFAMRLGGKKMVILLSGAVDSLLLKGDNTQLAWLIGHELGHHYAGHLNFWRRTTAGFGSWFIWVGLWYKRRCELTSDRYGLACTNNLNASLLAVCNMTVGAQLASKVNVDEAIAQWNKHRNEWLVKKRVRMHTHPANLWRLAELVKSAEELEIK